MKRKLKLDAVPTIFPGRIFIHEKVQRIKENWKNKELQKQMEVERLRIEREYKDRFKLTQTECTCKCRCKLRKKNFSQQVNFQFKFMKDVGVQYPKDLTQTVKDDHSYTQGKSRTGVVKTAECSTGTTASASSSSCGSDVLHSTAGNVEKFANSACSVSTETTSACEFRAINDNDNGGEIEHCGGAVKDESVGNSDNDNEEEEDFHCDQEVNFSQVCSDNSRGDVTLTPVNTDVVGPIDSEHFEVEVEYVTPPRENCMHSGREGGTVGGPPSQKKVKLDEFISNCT